MRVIIFYNKNELKWSPWNAICVLYDEATAETYSIHLNKMMATKRLIYVKEINLLIRKNKDHMQRIEIKKFSIEEVERVMPELFL